MDRPFAGRTAAVATKHGKEAVLRAALEPVGLAVVVADVDTDRFGTFTGEVPRKGSPHEGAERKARAAIAASGHDVGIGSEGSFGPHPSAPFVTADVEVLVLVDARVGMVVAEEAMSLATAAAGRPVVPGEELAPWLERVGFPSQALICRPADASPRCITKGIVDRSALEQAVARAAGASRDGRAVVETDLRAHLCPTRRAVIAAAGDRLAARLARRCPVCSTPGFGQVGVELGRPCGRCGVATSEVMATVMGCGACRQTRREAVGGPADPSCCPWCNP